MFPVGIDRHFLRCIKHRRTGIAAVAGITPGAGSGDGFDHAVADAADAASLPLHHIQRSIRCERHRSGTEHPGLRRRPTVSVVLRFAGPGEGVDNPGSQIHHPYPVSGNIGDNSRDWSGLRARPFGSTNPASSAGPPSPLYSADPLPAKVVTNPVVSITRTRRFMPVGEEHPARTIGDDAIRLVQLRACAQAAIAGKTAFAGAANCRNHPAAASIRRMQ